MLHVPFYQIVQDGEYVLLPTAKETWDSTISKVDVLISGCKLKDFLFETILVQQCLVMLVTGLEVYTKYRFLEMEYEGKKANTEALMAEFAKDESLKQVVESFAHGKNISILRSMVEVKGSGIINFQDWEKSKKGYNKGYNIKFGEIPNLRPSIIEAIRKYSRWRHRIIHSRVDMSVLNNEEVPPKEPIFANKEFIEKARADFIEFVENLHSYTLIL